LCHATGFHGHVWLPTAERLGAAGFHCYSFDERGHGDSGRPADGDFAWTGFATDALAVIEAAGLGGRRPLAAGWSCGGALLLRADVDFGFDDLPDGTVRLKCRGEDEAAVYNNGMRHSAFANLPSVACPVTISCGSSTDAFGPDAIGAMVDRLPHGRAEVLPGLTHFAPLEDP